MRAVGGAEPALDPDSESALSSNVPGRLPAVVMAAGGTIASYLAVVVVLVVLRCVVDTCTVACSPGEAATWVGEGDSVTH